MSLLHSETYHIDGQFLDQPFDYRQNGKYLQQMIMLLIIGFAFDSIGYHFPIETRFWVNNFSLKILAISQHHIDGPFLDQPFDYCQKLKNPEQMIMLLIIRLMFDPIQCHLPIETHLWVNINNSFIVNIDNLTTSLWWAIFVSARWLWSKIEYSFKDDHVGDYWV